MKNLSIYVLLLLGSCFLCACSSDDDSNDFNSLDGQSLSNPGVYGSDHKRLTSWAGVEFFYYDNGGIDSIATPKSMMDERMKFSPDQKKRWVYDKTHSWKDYTSELSFNKQGYITEIKSVAKEYDADQNIGGQLYQYDGNGHLTNIGYKSNDGNYHGNMTIVWENDTIVKISSDANDGNEKKITGYTFEYEGGVNRNEYLQYDGALLDTWHNRDLQALFILGYFGKGPKYLPTKYVKWSSGKKASEAKLTYKFNNDGTIYEGYGEYPNQRCYYYYK